MSFSNVTIQPGTSAFVDVAGTKIHYLAWNLAQREKPALLLIHGFRAHAHWWDGVVPAFLDRFRIVAMDFSGMGDSDFRAEYHGQDMVAEICGVIDALSLGTVHAVGHSYGGARLLYACAARPALFTQAIIVDSYIRFSDQAGFSGPRAMGSVRVHPDFVAACARFRLMPEQPGAWPELLQQVARHSLRRVEGGWRWKFDHEMKLNHQGELPGEQLLPSISTPIGFIYGEHSLVVSHEHAKRIVSLLPNVHATTMIRDSYHHIMLDQPTRFVEALRDCLMPGADASSDSAADAAAKP